MFNDNRNMIYAVVLSLAVVIGWQFLIVAPQVERAQQQAVIEAQRNANQGGVDLATPTGLGTGSGEVQEIVGATTTFLTRTEAIASDERVRIDTPSLIGSINLVGGRIDDLSLKNYTESVEPGSPIISLLSPSSGPDGYYVEQGWVTSGGTAKVPVSTSIWRVSGNGTLTPNAPVTLTFDNEEGLIFSRKIAVDQDYLFTITQTVENSSSGDVALFPYSRIARYGVPEVSGLDVDLEILVEPHGCDWLPLTSRRWDPGTEARAVS